ncbi:unnamed protein product [Vitrella brassicaformis CCMP3155]|uniref:Tubulin beta chain n=1 Tax=Vitrella brassicaformis (strain CCMP3155) TaxID=1169540 RepID=A0A0G4ED06_VITBC|nr:unnamed protein product [Vitrella brassicaformis CCMP3155]|mmetsp:Transcript_24775/g.61230  ORF Transcript_24775/g.61230 Transcript_24775/m.61230 type:complete len:785 (-) Transcript_24775:1028-3382(-)|eukprot:CEL93227.1 unnamed protein product [Vitrella brassicaformis CCMP3155]
MHTTKAVDSKPPGGPIDVSQLEYQTADKPPPTPFDKTDATVQFSNAPDSSTLQLPKTPLQLTDATPAAGKATPGNLEPRTSSPARVRGYRDEAAAPGGLFVDLSTKPGKKRVDPFAAAVVAAKRGEGLQTGDMTTTSTAFVGDGSPGARKTLSPRELQASKGIPFSSNNREIIHVQVGRAGNNISHEFWRDLVEEHHIYYQNFEKTVGTLHGKFCGNEADIYRLQQVGVFFDEASSGRYVPRSILVDLDKMFIDNLMTTDLGRLYRPENMFYTDEGSGNCYARAFHTSGPDICDAMTEGVRRMVEGCDCLQGVQFAHSLAGGTGSGLTSLMLNSMRDFFNRNSSLLGPILQTFTLFTSELASDILVEPYNAVLGFKDLIECCDQVFAFDNHALSNICQRTLNINVPRFQHMDDLVARVMSGITCNLRFPGILDADLRKMCTNLVPFPKTHFLITCTAPLSSMQKAAYRKYSILDLTQQMMQSENCVVDCDPLKVDTQEHWRTSRFLASFAAFRGKKERLATSEINDVLSTVPHNTVYDRHFPDWIPTCLSSCICTVPPAEKQFDLSVTYLTNCTAFQEVLERMREAWDKLYRAKAHLYIYEAEGMEVEEMKEAREALEDLLNRYRTYGGFPDRLEKDEATTDEQMDIIQSLDLAKEIYLPEAKSADIFMRSQVYTNVVGLSFALSPSAMRAHNERQQKVHGYGSGSRSPDQTGRRAQFLDLPDASLGGKPADISVSLTPQSRMSPQSRQSPGDSPDSGMGFTFTRNVGEGEAEFEKTGVHTFTH